jgi:Ca2+-binding EF-hand superfamily protein
MTSKFDELGISADPEAILSRYDRDRDGQMSYSEFSELITPQNLEY